GDLDERPAIAGQIEPKLPPESFRRPAGRLGWAGEVDAQVHAALYGRQELNTRLARRRPARPWRQDLKVRRVNARTREDEPSVRRRGGIAAARMLVVDRHRVSGPDHGEWRR